MRRAVGLPYRLCLCMVLPLFAASMHGSIGLVVGEPFGSFGTMLPVGHAGIYFDHLCVETATKLRPCAPGELGAVVSRYHDLKATQTDWLAFPLSTFLYGVDSPDLAPAYITASQEAEIRDRYRAAHLAAEVPNRIDKHGHVLPPAYGDWAEGIGAAFDRRLLIYEIDTTPAQDAALLTLLNGLPQRRRYTLGRANCADFAADILKVVVPGGVRRNVLGDFDIMTPKQLALTMDNYGRAHPELHPHVYEIPQIPGTLRRSRPIRGSAQLFLTTKRYLFTLIVIQPEAVLADWILYETKGRWTPGLDATALSPGEWQSQSAGSSATNAPDDSRNRDSGQEP